MTKYPLEAAAQQFVEVASKPPFLYQMTPVEARNVLNGVQAGPVPKPDIEEKWVTVPASLGDVRVRIVKPVGSPGRLPVILYMHGGGWVLGNAGTHDRLVRELSVGTGAAVAFVEYSPAPEAHYPVQIEQGYATAQWLTARGPAEGVDPNRMAVAGDSVGGNTAAVLALLAQSRGDVRFVQQSLYYPVTDAAQDTDSYREFKDGPYLSADSMAWFWDSYMPGLDHRFDITASPLRATTPQVQGLPPALVLTDENDVLRDEGEAYAAKLRVARVPTTSVRYNGTIHDFMMLNPLRDTRAARAAIGQASAMLRQALN